MQVKRTGRRRRRGHPILAAGLFLALMVGISYGAATLWQNLQERASPFPERSQPADAVDTIGAQAEAMIPLAPAVGAGAHQSSEASDADEEIPTDPVTDYTVDWQVKPSGQVPLSYFDDAVFFGDSVSTGLVGYHIVDNAACYAAVGVSPHTALTGEYIGASVDNKKTLLDAAKEAGERSKVYIMLGGNGLWMEQDAFIEDYQEFLDAVKAQYPDSLIYIQSMTPVGATVAENYEATTKEKVVAYNAAIAELAKKNGLPFVNVFECLMDENGYLPADVSPDGLHLTPEYYYKWLNYLRTHTVEETP